MTAAPKIVLLQLESPPEVFVTAVTSEYAEIQSFSLLNELDDITRVVIHFVVPQLHRIENSEAREPVAASLGENRIQ